MSMNLGNMGMNGLEMDTVGPLNWTPPAAGLGNGTMGEHNDDKFLDYADTYRVHAATASPLRRRASERLATSSGLSLPHQNAPGNLPSTFE